MLKYTCSLFRKCWPNRKLAATAFSPMLRCGQCNHPPEIFHGWSPKKAIHQNNSGVMWKLKNLQWVCLQFENYNKCIDYMHLSYLTDWLELPLLYLLIAMISSNIKVSQISHHYYWLYGSFHLYCVQWEMFGEPTLIFVDEIGHHQCESFHLCYVQCEPMLIFGIWSCWSTRPSPLRSPLTMTSLNTMTSLLHCLCWPNTFNSYLYVVMQYICTIHMVSIALIM